MRNFPVGQNTSGSICSKILTSMQVGKQFAFFQCTDNNIVFWNRVSGLMCFADQIQFKLISRWGHPSGYLFNEDVIYWKTMIFRKNPQLYAQQYPKLNCFDTSEYQLKVACCLWETPVRVSGQGTSAQDYPVDIKTSESVLIVEVAAKDQRVTMDTGG